MDKKKSKFRVGYGKPPHETRFKPGQSGNPGGRPKKTATTLAESFERELNARILITEGGKQRKITKLEAIAKQQINKAVNGDHKATAVVMRAVEPREADRTDNLSPVLQAMRAIHAKNEMANQKGTRSSHSSDLAGNVAGDTSQADNDED